MLLSKNLSIRRSPDVACPTYWKRFGSDAVKIESKSIRFWLKSYDHRKKIYDQFRKELEHSLKIYDPSFETIRFLQYVTVSYRFQFSTQNTENIRWSFIFYKKIVYFQFYDRIISVWGSYTFNFWIVYFQSWLYTFSFRIVYYQFKDRILSISGSYNFSHDCILSVLGSFTFNLRIVFIQSWLYTFSFRIVYYQFKDRILSVMIV